MSVNLVLGDIIKEFEGMYTCVLVSCLQFKRWTLERSRRARVCRTMKLWEINTMTKPNASSITSHQTLSPGDEQTFCHFSYLACHALPVS